MESKAEQINRITNDAKKKVLEYTKPKRVLASFQFIMCFILATGVNLIKFEFNFNAFKTPEFYITTLCTALAYILVFKATINFLSPKTETRDNVLKAKENYIQATSKKELDFKEYLEELNTKNKIELYIASVQHKIYKIEKKSIKSRKDKVKKKCALKVERLKELITNEYIEKNLNLISIKYRILYVDDFTEVENIGSSGLLPANTYNQELNKRSVQSVYLYVFSTALLSLGVITKETNTFGLVASIVATTISCIFRVASAVMQADEIYDKTITKSYIDKERILREYQEWRKSKPDIQKQIHDEELEAIKKEYDKKLEIGIKNSVQKILEQTKTEA